MDKEVLRYLADIATVRSNTQALLGVGRGVIDQKTLHAVGAKTMILDKLFVEVLLSGQAPGINAKAPNVVIRDDDDDDYVTKLAEAKAKIARGRASAPKTADVEASSEEDDSDEGEFVPPADEQSAYERLLAKAETEAAATASSSKKASKKKAGKKTVKKKAAVKSATTE